MTKRIRKGIFLFVLLVIVSATGIGYYLFNKGPINVRDEDGIKITAISLYQSFAKDSTEGLKKYAGKVLEVDGLVNSLSTNQKKQTIISLKTNTDGAFINCTLEEGVKGIKINDLVNIKGICSGIGQGDEDLGIKGDVYLTRCVMVK